MWYYEFNHEPIGPVSVETIADLLSKGTINALTLVWSESMPDWKHLGETELSELANRTQSSPLSPLPTSPAQTPAVSGAPVSPEFAPQQSKPRAAPTPRVNPQKLKNLFSVWVAALAIMTLYNVFAALFPSSNTMLAISCIVEIVVIAYVVLQYVLLFRFWKVNQDGYASTTPGRAVGFLFIPIFQIYWVFRAFCGLAFDQNRYIARHFDPAGITVRKAHPLFSFIYLIGSFIGGLSLYMIIFSSMLSSASAANFDLAAYSSLLAQFSIPILIFSLASAALTLLMFSDFYLTAKSIVDEEQKGQ